jgi:hypothetical protein
MATRLYFRDTANSGSGTFPSAYNTSPSDGQIGWQDPSATFSLRSMTTTAGSSHTSTSIATSAVTSTVRSAMGIFISPPLNGAQTVGGGSIILNAAETESNTNSNFWINNTEIYVWRPSTGAKVGTVRAKSATGFGGTEPTSASSIQVSHITGISAADGDVIVVIVGSIYTQGMATSYTDNFYFGGSTVTTTENTVVTNHASFIEFTENLSFQTVTPPADTQSFFQFF